MVFQQEKVSWDDLSNTRQLANPKTIKLVCVASPLSRQH